MLSKIRQTKQDKYCMTPLIRGTWNRQIHRDRGRIKVMGWRQGEQGVIVTWEKFLFGMLKNLEMDNGNGGTTL